MIKNEKHINYTYDQLIGDLFTGLRTADTTIVIIRNDCRRVSGVRCLIVIIIADIYSVVIFVAVLIIHLMAETAQIENVGRVECVVICVSKHSGMSVRYASDVLSHLLYRRF